MSFLRMPEPQGGAACVEEPSRCPGAHTQGRDKSRLVPNLLRGALQNEEEAEGVEDAEAGDAGIEGGAPLERARALRLGRSSWLELSPRLSHRTCVEGRLALKPRICRPRRVGAALRHYSTRAESSCTPRIELADNLPRSVG